MSWIRRLLASEQAAPQQPRRPAAPAEEARIIFLDRPAPGATLQASQAFDGWTVSPDPGEMLAVTVNGTALPVHTVPRPDVEAARPAQNAKGFMFFVEPDPAVTDYRVVLRIGDVTREYGFNALQPARSEAAQAAAIRAAHRAFLATALACPKCHAPIVLEQLSGRRWSCAACQEAFDCRAGLDLIPESYPSKRDISFQGAICSHSYHQDVERIVERAAACGGMVLDCGAGWRAPHPNVITTEIVRYPSTDVVAISEYLPFRDGAFEAVLSLHVLEHVKNPFVCARELARVLKPGGTLHAVTPYIVGVHGFPFHFFNPTPAGLQALFEGLIADARVGVPHNAHPIAALKDLLGAYLEYFDPADREAFRRTSIGELIDSSYEAAWSGALAQAFRDEGKNVLAGNYSITGRKA